MKKWICLFVAFVLMLGMTACGSETPEDVAGSVTPVETGNVAPTEAENEVSMGRMEGGTYTNEYAGFAMDLDSSWTFYSAEELQEMPENVAEALKGSELEEAISALPQFTDMMAESVEQMATVNVLYQKLDMQTRLAYAVLNDSQILDLVLGESDMMISSYAQTGIEVQSMEKKTVTFLGQERDALYTVAKVQGMDYYILQLFDYHLGNYSVTITFASFVEDKTVELLDLCRPLD